MSPPPGALTKTSSDRHCGWSAANSAAAANRSALCRLQAIVEFTGGEDLELLHLITDREEVLVTRYQDVGAETKARSKHLYIVWVT